MKSYATRHDITCSTCSESHKLFRVGSRKCVDCYRSYFRNWAKNLPAEKKEQWHQRKKEWEIANPDRKKEINKRSYQKFYKKYRARHSDKLLLEIVRCMQEFDYENYDILSFMNIHVRKILKGYKILPLKCAYIKKNKVQ